MNPFICIIPNDQRCKKLLCFNYLKKSLFIYLCLLIAFTNCQDDDDQLSLSTSQIEVSSEGGEESIEITSNTGWQALFTDNDAASWISLSPLSGNSKNNKVKITFDENKEYEERSAEILFKAGKATQTLRITQKMSEELRLATHTIVCEQKGGKLGLKVYENVDYTIHISKEAQSWIQPIETKTLNEDSIYFQISENTDTLTRKGSIILQANDSEISDTFTVYQQELSLELSSQAIAFFHTKSTKKVYVTSTHTTAEGYPDYIYTFSPTASSWCTIEPSEDKKTLSISVEPNNTDEPRATDIIITASVLKKTLHITQSAKSDEKYYEDKEYIQLQKATKGKGVNIVLMGDGFTKTDLQQGGYYESTMRQSADYFFSIEPYASYRDYFNVYMIAAESEEEGVSNANQGIRVDNKFRSSFGEGTAIDWDYKLCLDYVDCIPELNGQPNILSILILNSNYYAGTTVMSMDGYAVAACPMSREEPPLDFEGLIHHEAGGHGFGFLNDEYVYYETQQLPKGIKEEIKMWHAAGYFQNTDVTNLPTQVIWKDFIGMDKYPAVGFYEGANMYGFGIWRPEEESCMDRNIAYYNAPSRWSIVKRIMQLAGEPFTFDDFVRTDHVQAPPETKSGLLKPVPPLGRPILLTHSLNRKEIKSPVKTKP